MSFLKSLLCEVGQCDFVIFLGFCPLRAATPALGKSFLPDLKHNFKSVNVLPACALCELDFMDRGYGQLRDTILGLGIEPGLPQSNSAFNY